MFLVIKVILVIFDTNQSCTCNFWTPGGSRNGPIKQGLSVCSVLPSILLSVLPSVLLFGGFLGSVLLVFSEFWHGATNPPEVVRDRAGFSGNNFFKPQNLGKWTKNGLKTGFSEFIERFGHQFLLNLFYNENLHYLLCSCTNPIFGKIFVPEIWTKMFSANQIAGFF